MRCLVGKLGTGSLISRGAWYCTRYIDVAAKNCGERALETLVLRAAQGAHVLAMTDQAGNFRSSGMVFTIKLIGRGIRDTESEWHR